MAEPIIPARACLFDPSNQPTDTMMARYADDRRVCISLHRSRSAFPRPSEKNVPCSESRQAHRVRRARSSTPGRASTVPAPRARRIRGGCPCRGTKTA